MNGEVEINLNEDVYDLTASLGSSVTLANDLTWASMTIYLGDGKAITIKGTPKKLRKIARHLSEGLRDMRKYIKPRTVK